MFSYPESDEVIEGLGDKAVEAFSRSVARSADDLRQYRDVFPSFVSQSSDRGLANWIHDRLWHHLAVLLDGMEKVRLHESGPTREMIVGNRYRLRAKRHSERGAVSAYPTQGMIEFMIQDIEQPTLFDGYDEIRLIVGYIWDPDTRAMGGPVLSLRDGVENLVWMVELPDVGTGYAGGVVIPIVPPLDGGPAAPIIEFAEQNDQTGESERR
ncbi:hypothetical protein [Herbidospora mongoliensis]|uniref:hypothetical protein n=1 Tax=Herbidospora mongoliensis TaxID=688067 RepID=UPI000831CAEC|nr:hypothetical protein [Herbidospora mongoliensis]